MAYTWYYSSARNFGSNKEYRAFIGFDVTSTATTTTIKYGFGVQMRHAALYGVAATLSGSASGSCEGYLKSSPGSTWKDVCIKYDSVSYTRGHSTVSKSFTSTAKGKTVSGYGAAGGAAVSITKAVSVPARASYAVTYNANEGTGAPAKQTKWYGENLTLSTTQPTRNNYVFLGWSTSSTATTPTYAPGAIYTGNAALTLYAVWKLNTYTITYDANGGVGAPESQTQTINSPVTIPTEVPTRDGYTFNNWGTSQQGGTIYVSGESYIINTTSTLYAQWSPNTYNIEYSPGDGHEDFTLPVTFDSSLPSVEIPTSSLVSEEFKGYFTKSGDSFDEEYYDKNGIPVKKAYQVVGDLQLYGKWGKKVFSITYNTNTHYTEKITSQPVEYSQQGVYGDDITLKNPDEMFVLETGYTWDSSNWYSAATGSASTFGFNSTIHLDTDIPQELNLYARAVEQTVTITFDGNSPEGYSVTNLPYPEEGNKTYSKYFSSIALPGLNTGTSITPPICPKHTFLGWSKSSSATEPEYPVNTATNSYNFTEDTTLYAIWSWKNSEVNLHYRNSVTGNWQTQTYRNVPVSEGDYDKVTYNDAQDVPELYGFLGWSDVFDETLEPYSATSESVGVSNEVIIADKYEQDFYAVYKTISPSTINSVDSSIIRPNIYSYELDTEFNIYQRSILSEVAYEKLSNDSEYIFGYFKLNTFSNNIIVDTTAIENTIRVFSQDSTTSIVVDNFSVSNSSDYLFFRLHSSFLEPSVIYTINLFVKDNSSELNAGKPITLSGIISYLTEIIDITSPTEIEKAKIDINSDVYITDTSIGEITSIEKKSEKNTSALQVLNYDTVIEDASVKQILLPSSTVPFSTATVNVEENITELFNDDVTENILTVLTTTDFYYTVQHDILTASEILINLDNLDSGDHQELKAIQGTATELVYESVIITYDGDKTISGLDSDDTGNYQLNSIKYFAYEELSTKVNKGAIEINTGQRTEEQLIPNCEYLTAQSKAGYYELEEDALVKTDIQEVNILEPIIDDSEISVNLNFGLDTITLTFTQGIQETKTAKYSLDDSLIATIKYNGDNKIEYSATDNNKIKLTTIIYYPTRLANTIYITNTKSVGGNVKLVATLKYLTYYKKDKTPSFSFGNRINSDKGGYSVTAGEGLIAYDNNQTAIGKYNKAEEGDNVAFYIGNGTNDANRSNALTVGFNGEIKSPYVGNSWISLSASGTVSLTNDYSAPLPYSTVISKEGTSLTHANGIITCLEDGVVEISAQSYNFNISKGVMVYLYLTKNGTRITGSTYLPATLGTGSVGYGQAVITSYLLPVTAGDELALVGRANNGTATFAEGGRDASFFTVKYIQKLSVTRVEKTIERIPDSGQFIFARASTTPITATTEDQIVPYNNLIAQEGDLLRLTPAGQIECLASGYVEISAKIQYDSLSTNSNDLRGLIRINNDIVQSERLVTNTDSASLDLHPQIQAVNTGDIIDVVTRNNNAGTAGRGKFGHNTYSTFLVKYVQQYTINHVTNILDIDAIYPIGSIYLSMNSANPSSIFGGMWQLITDRFLVGAGRSYVGGATGGEASHALTVNELPSHSHKIPNQVFRWINKTANVASGSNVRAFSEDNNVYTGSAGGGAAHENRPPYLAVYMWQRIS